MAQTIIEHTNGLSVPIFEDNSAEAITPGELLTFDVAGELESLKTAPSLDTKVDVEPMVAIEDRKGGNAIDDDWQSGDPVEYATPLKGQVMLMWLGTGTDDEVAPDRGELLEPNGTNGNLRIQQGIDTTGDGTGEDTETVFNGHLVGAAHEEADNSGGSSRVRLPVRII